MNLSQIVQGVAHKIQLSPLIHAMWIEGSYATGKYNEKSDIDVWLDVKDGSFDESIATFRQALSEVANIEHETTRGVYSEDPRLIKQTFFLENFPPGQVIELDLQEHSRNFVFSKSEHVIKVLFDKDDTIKWEEG